MIGKQRKTTMETPRLKVRTAVVCVQCETLYGGKGRCPICGSRAVQPLTDWLPSMEEIPMVRRLQPTPIEVA